MDMIDAEALADTMQGRVDMDSFEGVVDHEEIVQDKEKCKKLDAKMRIQDQGLDSDNRKETEKGAVAEAVFHKAIEKYGWLSKNASIHRTSRYDDVINDMDAFVEILLESGERKHLGFAIDFTISLVGLKKKLEHAFLELDQGKIPTIKYFQASNGDKQKDFPLPRVVVGSGRETLERLAAYNLEILGKSHTAQESEQALRKDSFKAVLFGEIETQLIIFIERLKKVITIAEREKRDDIEEGATTSLAIHQKALEVVQDLATKAGITEKTIQQHIRGDSFAGKMREDLGELLNSEIKFPPRGTERKK